MPAFVRRLTTADDAALAVLWQAAIDVRRGAVGLEPLVTDAPVLQRPGAFGVGVFEADDRVGRDGRARPVDRAAADGGDGELVAAAVAMPARADDGCSDHHVPGLAHISSVVTHPDRWGEGLGGRVVGAVMSHAVRRGYARAQLWTQVTNAGANRLYEREGFVRSGRQRTEHGERIIHYLRDLPVLPTTSRPAARLLCLDSEERVLLLHFRDPYDGHQLWEPPGGGLEPGESPLEAVLREWVEETSLPLPQVAVTATLVARDLVWRGARWVGDEHFFLGRTTDMGVPLQAEGIDQAMDAYLGSAWVAWRELQALADPVEPDLLPALRRLDPTGPWADLPT